MVIPASQSNMGKLHRDMKEHDALQEWQAGRTNIYWAPVLYQALYWDLLQWTLLHDYYSEGLVIFIKSYS